MKPKNKPKNKQLPSWDSNTVFISDEMIDSIITNIPTKT